MGGDDQVLKGINDIKTSVAAMGDKMANLEKMEDNNAGVLKEVAASAGLDPEKVMTMASMGNHPGNQDHENDPAAMGGAPDPDELKRKMMGNPAAAGAMFARDQEMKDMKAQLKALQDEKAKRDKDEELRTRLTQANIIAKGEIALHEIEESDLEKRIKHYAELKNPNTGKLEDLHLMSQKYQTVLDRRIMAAQQPVPEPPREEQTVAASGFVLNDGYPVGGATSTEPTVSDLDRMEDSL